MTGERSWERGTRRQFEFLVQVGVYLRIYPTVRVCVRHFLALVFGLAACRTFLIYLSINHGHPSIHQSIN